MLLIPGTGNGGQGTGNREQGTGNREPGTGVWERVYSSNPLVIFKMADKGKEEGTIWENVRKCLGCNGEVLPAVHRDESTFLL